MKILLAIIFFTVVSGGSKVEISDNEYEFIDGILVTKKAKITDQGLQQNRKDATEGNEDVFYQDYVTEDDAPEENREMTNHLPTKCHGR